MLGINKLINRSARPECTRADKKGRAYAARMYSLERCLSNNSRTRALQRGKKYQIDLDPNFDLHKYKNVKCKTRESNRTDA